MLHETDFSGEGRLSRQTDMIDKSITRVKLLSIACGGINSNALHVLASMGVTDIQVIEPDVVTTANIYPGFFPAEHKSQPKAAAVLHGIHTMLGANCGVSIKHFDAKLEDVRMSELDPYNVVLIGTDSLDTRRKAFTKFYLPNVFWMDARMGGTGADLFCLHDNTTDEALDHYRESLQGDGDPLPCGMKATAAMTKGFIPGMIGDAMRDFVNGHRIAYHYRYDMRDKGFVCRWNV